VFGAKESASFAHYASAALDAKFLTESPMIFRQLFDSTSETYTYLLASRRAGEALIIDP
jgi:hypothetical protein